METLNCAHRRETDPNGFQAVIHSNFDAQVVREDIFEKHIFVLIFSSQ